MALARDGVALGAALTGRIDRNAVVFVDLGADVRKRQWSGAATAGLRYGW